MKNQDNNINQESSTPNDKPKDMFAVIEEVMHDLLTEVAVAYNENEKTKE